MSSALNAICPYYTMFPLSFPLRAIQGSSLPGWVVDPFCGRGTTNFAARILGKPTVGIDSSPIATAIAEAKLCVTTEHRLVELVRRLLSENDLDEEPPSGPFWKLMYHKSTLKELCVVRAALLRDCRSQTRQVLRAIVLGALHGPLTKQQPSHLSNQSPRTYAPKPDYAVRYWQRRGMRPPRVRIVDVVAVRARRYLEDPPARTPGFIMRGDSRRICSQLNVPVSLVITSPPYYGMRTYIPDQWLRNWFLGGPAQVDYKFPDSEISHGSPASFSQQLNKVWRGLARCATRKARMVIRFGGINDRDAEPILIAKESFAESGWVLTTIKRAGDASVGKRQASQFLTYDTEPRPEYDLYARLA